MKDAFTDKQRNFVSVTHFISFSLHIRVYVFLFHRFIGFVRARAFFFENTLRSVGSSSVIVRGWRTCVIGRNSFRTIYMPRGNCVSGARMARGPLFRWQRLSSVLSA